MTLNLILLTWRKWYAPNNASRWQMGFNPAFKGLRKAGNTGNWKRKCWMVVSVEYGVEEAMDLSHGLHYDGNN
jgi:DNA-binding transcriptional regulator of glucitol operon